MIDQIDVSVPAEYISEVIPIKYAMAEDIASALNSLGGSGGSTVSFGSSGATPSTGGASRRRYGGFRRNRRHARYAIWRGKSAAAIWLTNGARRHADGWHYFSAKVAVHHSTRLGRTTGPDPGFWPGENHCRPAEQFTAHFCNAGGHGKDQGRGGEIGRAALTSAHRVGHHGRGTYPFLEPGRFCRSESRISSQSP